MAKKYMAMKKVAGRINLRGERCNDLDQSDCENFNLYAMIPTYGKKKE